MKEQSPSLITIIVPVYNVEGYLMRCLDSIVKQTYKHLEIILVNDGSSDSSGEICRTYQKKDSRIVLIDKDNGGLSEARNYGLARARGDYITFVDSDDYIHGDYVRSLYCLLKDYHADISIVGARRVYDTQANTQESRQSRILCLTGEEALKNMLYQRKIINNAWGKMYAKQLFDSVRFPVGRLYEDLGTLYKLFYKSRRVALSSERLYYYYQRKDSIMNREFSMKNMDRIVISGEIMEWAGDKQPDLYKASIARFFTSNMQVLRTLPLDNREYDNCLMEVEDNIKKYRNIIIADKNVKPVNRIIAFSSFLNPYILQKMGKIYKYLYEYLLRKD